jgi:hypothetical protein
MQYLSPSTFSGETLSASLDIKAIQLARKKLFADLELSGGSTIELNGKAFTKNDIIQYFESLLKEDALSYHNAVGEDQVMLIFLEHAWIGRKEKFQNNSLYEDVQFIQWISPYFCNSFITFMEACFQAPDEEGLTALLNNRLLMTPGDIEKCWEAVTRFIMNDIATLERYHTQGKTNNGAGDVTLSQLRDLMDFHKIRIIQLLPVGRFASLRDKYALCMQNACIVTFNNHIRYRSNVKTWMENAQLLAVTFEIKAQLGEKMEEMDAILAPAENQQSESGGAAVVKFIIIALVILSKLATCGFTYPRPTNNHQNTRFVFPQNKMHSDSRHK